METASPTLFFPPTAAPGYGAAPPASRVATAIAARRAYGPPLTPQPLRPLTAQSARAGAQPLPARTARRSAHIKIKPLQTKSLRFQGIATGRPGRDHRQALKRMPLKARFEPPL